MTVALEVEPVEEPVADTGRNRLAELRQAAANLHRRASTAGTERWLLLAGAILVPLGLVLIVAGYWGAAHAPRVIQQIPYQLSGGVLGTALVFAGGFSYFAYWLTQILNEQQRTAARLDAQTAALVEELRALRAAVVGVEAVSDEPDLVTTPGGTLAHLPSCPVVAGRADTKPAAAGSRPCKVCLGSA